MTNATARVWKQSAKELELQLALAFTEAYKSHRKAHPAWREAMCLDTQFPGRLDDIRPEDLIAGRKRPGFIVMFSPQVPSVSKGDQCAYCFDSCGLPEATGKAGDAAGKDAEGLTEFWNRECTWQKVQDGLDEELRQYLETDFPPRVLAPGSSRMGYGGGLRIAGVMLDFGLLLRGGIPGLRAQVTERKQQAQREASDTVLFDSMLVALDVVVKSCLYYRDQAESLMGQADGARRAELRAMADALDAVSRRAPASFREAIQLFWLYSVIADVFNYARLDVCLGDFYADDLDAGVLSESEAKRLLVSLWLLIDDTQRPWDTRLVVGGMGRRNEANADRFALAAMEATRTVRRIMPQLTLQCHRGQNPALLEKALDVLGEGCQFPSLYNDNVLVPAMARQFNVSLPEAEHYLPLGCGEMTLGHLSIGSPNGAFNIIKALEAALHNGCDGVSGERIGPETGPLSRFASFDDLVAAFQAQVRFAARLFAKRTLNELAVERREAAFLHVSMLTADCLARGKALLDGGCRYRGGCVEGFGCTNAGDGLAAIRELVYEKKILTLERLAAALDADFAGYQKERRTMLACPKYGNDIDAVDSLVVSVSSFVCDVFMKEGRKAGLSFLILSNVNPGGYVMGAASAASADGRKRGEPLAIGNSPAAGRDKSGPTAFLKSVAKPNPENGGVTTNVKISRELFSRQRAKVGALLKTYFAIGGMQAHVTVVSRDELEKALLEPAKCSHVLVRLGGYSARFVELDPVIQREIIERTLY
jgi:pyruvate-formate lyase